MCTRSFHGFPLPHCSTRVPLHARVLLEVQIIAFRVHISQVVSRFSDWLIYSTINTFFNSRSDATKAHGILAVRPTRVSIISSRLSYIIPLTFV
jgi:hypothetical protein